jgi:hypothetical protein
MAIASFSTITVHASMILVGQGVIVTAADTSALPAGSPIATHTSNVSQGGVTATLKSDVYSNDATNSLGGLTFVYTLTNGATSDALERVNFDGYSGTKIDVDYEAGSAPPSTATRSTATQDSGDLLGFNFQDPFGSPDLLSGEQAVLIVHTDATTEVTDSSNMIDDVAVKTTALAPEAGTNISPEPASLSILGLGAVALLRRRK